MSVRLRRFMERSGVLPTARFDYRKGQGTCDSFLCVSHTLQVALEVDRRLGFCRLTFIWSTMRDFTIIMLWSVGNERLHELKIYSIQRRRERYIIIYIWKITQHMVLNFDGTMGHEIKIKQKTCMTWNTVCY